MGSVVRNAEDKNQKERKTNLLVLVRDYLLSEGYLDTLKTFESESKLSKEWILCDNVDLSTVIEEFEAYYFVRFKKYPKISRKNTASLVETKNKEKRKCVVKPKVELAEACAEKSVESDCLKVEPIGQKNSVIDSGNSIRLWKGLGTFEGYNDEWKTFADVIAREVIDQDLNVKWEDVIGLESAKQHLREAIVYPIKHPEIFKGILSPWKGLLLYGPSGTGKTLLAKAVATECSTTFFNISASSLVSKWRGDSEKLVRVMFELARHQAPSTIFIDELDALASKRDRPSEHEASRRLKSEFFVQLDGLLESSKNIFLLTTSNLPWDLDPAILRRLEKKIFVDCPDKTARTALFEKYLPTTINRYIKTDLDYQELARCTSGYTGADLKVVCKEALMEVTRNLIPTLEQRDRYGIVTCKTVTTEHILNVLHRVKPVAANVHKYCSWTGTS